MANVGFHLHISYPGTNQDVHQEAIRWKTAAEYRDILANVAAFIERLSAGEGGVSAVQLSFSPTAPVNASATATCASVIAGNTLVIGGTTLTAVAQATASPTTVQFRIGTDDATCATNICQAINNNATIRSKVYATVAAAVVTIKAKDPGQAGNAITLTQGGGTITVTGGGVLASGAGNDGAPYWVANGASAVATQGGAAAAPTGLSFGPTGTGLITFTTS